MCFKPSTVGVSMWLLCSSLYSLHVEFCCTTLMDQKSWDEKKVRRNGSREEGGGNERDGGNILKFTEKRVKAS